MNDVANPPENSADVKLAPALPGTLELIRQRWSPRSFSNREVADGDIKLLLEAARWASSCFNEQPWRFIIGAKSDPEAYEKILGVLVEKNREWARSAPLLMLTAGKRTFTHNGAHNHYQIHDAGIALAHMMLQGESMGLHVHGMGGFDHKSARAAFAIPEDYELGAAVAVGYLGDPAALSPQFQEMERAPRTRKALHELVFTREWGTPANLGD